MRLGILTKHHQIILEGKFWKETLPEVYKWVSWVKLTKTFKIECYIVVIIL